MNKNIFTYLRSFIPEDGDLDGEGRSVNFSIKGQTINIVCVVA